MQKVVIANTEFQFEKLDAERFTTGAAAFRVLDKDGDESFWVVVPKTVDEFDNGISTPKDGRVSAFCHDRRDALMLAASVNTSFMVARVKRDALEDECRKAADRLGIDLDKVEAEIERLKAEGKTAKEVHEILNQKIGEFKKDGGPSERKAGEW